MICKIVFMTLISSLVFVQILIVVVFFFNDTATTEIYTYLHTLSLHDALPISAKASLTPTALQSAFDTPRNRKPPRLLDIAAIAQRSEEHTSELQSLMRISYAVFCLKKKKIEHERRNECLN